MVKRKHKRRLKKAGSTPGTLTHVGEKKIDQVKIDLIDYDQDNILEKRVEKISECFPFKTRPTVTWININGLHEIDIIRELGNHFDIHPLVLEDILNTEQRPKLEDMESYVFITLKMLSYDDATNGITIEQVSLILGPNFVISFQEREGDVFDPVRERLRNLKGKIRKRGTDYLAYALIDSIVDHYFLVLEKFSNRIEELEDELVTHPRTETLQTIHNLKREMIFLRKSVWPLREVISAMERGGSSLIEESTQIFLRDVYDHTIQVIDTIESLRDMVSGMLDTYLSSISNRMNEVMKVLTIIATIFIPLTFIAGIYGMNFEYMPELTWRWSYFVVWIFMIAVGLAMFVYFRRRRWL